jgi:hypothetical protein
VVPLGTYYGQNRPLQNVLCTLSASYIPFAKTKAEREASGDKRLSIQERYTDYADYVTRITEAAQALAQEGFMIDEDVEFVIRMAKEKADLWK